MTEKLRVVTLNIHKGLSQFNRRMVIHELREGIGALKPDVVFLQEVAGVNQRHAQRFAAWPGKGQHEFLAGEELQHVYGRNRVHQYGHYGNAVLTRFPIVSHENEDISDHRFERRGMLHTVLKVPGWRRNLHCVCVHLSLHEGGRKRQLDALSRRLQELVERNAPIIIAGDFNDWRQRASPILQRSLGMTEASLSAFGSHLRTYPSVLPMFRLDRIYVRGFAVLKSQVHRGPPWSLLSDHLAVSAELERA
jgi:endonuclease/exonuclease/phosphatase family metal-dependent hydrolase